MQIKLISAFLLFGFASAVLWADDSSAGKKESELAYPETRKVDQVDDYFGTKVPDPYRWLEQDVRESDEVRQWTETQNAVTRELLDSIAARQQIIDKLTKLWNYPKYSAPSKKADKYFFSKNDGLQNQSVLYVSESYDGEAKVLLDPNAWSEDGTVALAGASASDDAKYLAYSISEAGSDWKKMRILDTDSGKDLDETLHWLRWGSATWTKDNQGFYYARYPEPAEGEAYQALALNQMVYYHKLGTPQSEDTLIYKRDDHPDWSFGLDLTHDNKYLVMSFSKSTDDQNQVFYTTVDDTQNWKPLVDDFENQMWFVASDEDTFYFLTDLDAPTKRIVAMDLANPGRANVREIVPAADETLESVSFVNHMLVTSYLKDASTQVRIFDLDGKLIRDVEFPGFGTASGFSGRPEDTETFYSFSSYATPPSIYYYNMETGESKLFRQSEVDFDPSQYEVTQVFYPSKDGTKIPMFIAHQKGLKLDGSNPTLLYGYGGFNIPLTPSFSISYVAWMQMGGVVAVANLRGGGEYGERWHVAGKKDQKQNVFDDFISAAEWLIAKKYTSTPKLAIQGGSNGGLLVGACMTQRPDLFGACLPAVGVMDMLRFQKFTAGRFWVDEYGSSDDETEFKTLVQYSPYHNLKEGVRYPATLVATADTDDRVVPMHSFKFAARLQECHVGPDPVLIRIESKAGHGAGTPTSKRIENIADHWAFLVEALDMTLPAGFSDE